MKILSPVYSTHCPKPVSVICLLMNTKDDISKNGNQPLIAIAGKKTISD